MTHNHREGTAKAVPFLTLICCGPMVPEVPMPTIPPVPSDAIRIGGIQGTREPVEDSPPPDLLARLSRPKLAPGQHGSFEG